MTPSEAAKKIAEDYAVMESIMVEDARRWLIAGGGGFEDGEDGIRACTMSAEHAIELMGQFAAIQRGEVYRLGFEQAREMLKQRFHPDDRYTGRDVLDFVEDMQPK